VAPVENASGLKFVGPTVDGYVSPDAKKAALPPTDASQSTAQTDRDTVIPPSIAAATDASTAKQGADTPKADSRFLHVALHAPAHDAFAHNSYNVHIIPDDTPHNTKFVKTTISPTSSSWPGRKATKSYLGNPILSMGNGDDTPMKIVDPDMIFGELSSADIPAIVIRSDPQPDQVAPVQESQTRVAEDSKADNDAPVASSTTTLAPPVAKPKPSSWAALLGGGKAKQAAPSETASLGPSSIRVSPSKSVISLMTDTDAPVSDPVTPKSAAPSLPPPSTGVSATNGPRPAFNYAAAAAAGKNLSPENELVKLLTEGLKARSQKPTLPANVPRGLVNTGNMCFANTVSSLLPTPHTSALIRV
jgi:ubiquitin carboxyl-terminal hydrolase 10